MKKKYPFPIVILMVNYAKQLINQSNEKDAKERKQHTQIIQALGLPETIDLEIYAYFLAVGFLRHLIKSHTKKKTYIAIPTDTQSVKLNIKDNTFTVELKNNWISVKNRLGIYPSKTTRANYSVCCKRFI